MVRHQLVDSIFVLVGLFAVLLAYWLGLQPLS